MEKVFSNIEDLKENIIFKHFYNICQIPHPSFKEEKLSNYIKNWAKDLNLEVMQDEFYNLLIRKPANKMEESKPIILQAHLDMVCEKNDGVKHDFDKDSIKWVLEGDILSTGETTTLGADDGVGVAIAMAILENDSLKHPQIDVIFTTSEEEDLSGALNLDKSWFVTNRIINLDNSVESQLIVGSAGGQGTKITTPIDYIKVDKKNYYTYKIELSDLIGGHSGEDINKGRANAIVSLAFILSLLDDEFDFYIEDIKGGNFRLAIPRESECKILVDKSKTKEFEASFEMIKNKILQKYSTIEENFKIRLLQLETNESDMKVVDNKSKERILDIILLSPNGINDMLNASNCVESSDNLGEIFIEDERIYFIYEIRSVYEISRKKIYKSLESLAKLTGSEITKFAEYPSWVYKTDSQLQDIVDRTYEDIHNKKMDRLVIHAGLECGCFANKVENMDAVSIGPDTWNLHSPSEKVSVSSTIRVYEHLVSILESLN